MQYSFTQDEGFTGTCGGATCTPKADENVVMASFRYYPF
jgi:hypothetical protein